MGDDPGTSTSEDKSHVANLVVELVEEIQRQKNQGKAELKEIVDMVHQYESVIVKSPEHVKSIAILRKHYDYTGSICIPKDLDKKAKKAIRRKANKAGIPIDEEE